VYNIKTRVGSQNVNVTVPDSELGGEFWPTLLVVFVSGGICLRRSLFIYLHLKCRALLTFLSLF